MRSPRIILLLIAVRLAGAAAPAAEENRYDLVSRLLAPFANVFVNAPAKANHALSFEVRLEQMTNLPAEFTGAKAEIAAEYPDKVRLHGPLLGENVTVCRHGDALWASPGSRVEELLKTAAAEKKLPKLDPKAKLENFSLPISEKSIALLPTLLQIKDIGSEPVDGKTCRVMDLFLLPELRKALKETWAARAWVGADARPVRISLAKPGWMMVLRFDKVDFPTKLPDSTWEPTAEEAGDVLKLDAPRYLQLVGSIVK